MKQYRAAIIGCGGIHKTHAACLRAMDNVDIVAVCDIVQERAEESAELNGAVAYTDYRELLKRDDIDAVHITLPHYLHVPVAEAALEAGKHIYLEKPLGLNLPAAEHLVKRYENEFQPKGLKATISFQNRTNPASLKIKELIASGVYGKLRGIYAEVTWMRDYDYYMKSGWRGFFATEGGGVLINQSIHTMDLMQWFAGAAPESIYAMTANRDHEYMEVEDAAEAEIRFANGVKGLFYATTDFVEDSSVEMKLVFDDATLKLWNDTLFELKDRKIRVLTEPESEVNAQKAYWGMGHPKLISRFYESIGADDESMNISPREALVTMKLIDGIYKSSAMRKYVSIN